MIDKKQLQQMLTESSLFQRALAMVRDKTQRQRIETLTRSYLDECAGVIIPTCANVRGNAETFKNLQEEVQKRAAEVVTDERTGRKRE